MLAWRQHKKKEPSVPNDEETCPEIAKKRNVARNRGAKTIRAPGRGTRMGPDQQKDSRRAAGRGTRMGPGLNKEKPRNAATDCSSTQSWRELGSWSESRGDKENFLPGATPDQLRARKNA